ncbi:MAG: hypothetical protein KF777_11860 [Planctomycetaceae bacterium]|nr:hypothetical protein [Planctomycetaceae bacterium]
MIHNCGKLLAFAALTSGILVATCLAENPSAEEAGSIPVGYSWYESKRPRSEEELWTGFQQMVDECQVTDERLYQAYRAITANGGRIGTGSRALINGKPKRLWEASSFANDLEIPTTREEDRFYLEECTRCFRRCLPALVDLRPLYCLRTYLTTPLTDQEIGMLSKIVSDPYVIELGFGGDGFNDATAAILKEPTRLRGLWLVKTSISDDTLPLIAALDTLQTVDLSGNSLSGPAILHNLKHLSLTSLDLSHTFIEDDSLHVCQEMKQLESLGLAGTTISTKAISHLSHLEKLRWLDVSDTCIDDSSVDLLIRHRKLQTLIVDKRALSESARATLHRRLPKCHVSEKE